MCRVENWLNDALGESAGNIVFSDNNMDILRKNKIELQDEIEDYVSTLDDIICDRKNTNDKQKLLLSYECMVDIMVILMSKICIAKVYNDCSRIKKYYALHKEELIGISINGKTFQEYVVSITGRLKNKGKLMYDESFTKSLKKFTELKQISGVIDTDLSSVSSQFQTFIKDEVLK